MCNKITCISEDYNIGLQMPIFLFKSFNRSRGTVGMGWGPKLLQHHKTEQLPILLKYSLNAKKK